MSYSYGIKIVSYQTAIMARMLLNTKVSCCLMEANQLSNLCFTLKYGLMSLPNKLSVQLQINPLHVNYVSLSHIHVYMTCTTVQHLIMYWCFWIDLFSNFLPMCKKCLNLRKNHTGHDVN